MAVERGHLHADDVLRGKAVSALSTPDRHLATALVLGVLRWQLQLDHRLQAYLKRPHARLDAEVLIALRLGAFQLLHLDRIPARAAIDESVELAKQAGHRFASGMVNAVLRKLAVAQALNETEQKVLEGSASAQIAPVEAHPAWMVERWKTFFGEESARAICCHDQAEPRLSIRFDDPGVESELIEGGITLVSGELLAAARIVVKGDITATEAFRAGRVRIQDEGSQLVAEIAGKTTAAAPARILDCCAAPGGKTLILAERNPEACITACESSAQRMEALRTRLASLGERVECRHGDAAGLDEESAYDLVLADVPCSGTGTLARNPEIRHRLRVEDLSRQAERQRAILTAAVRAVRPGGRVVYSTCSLEPEENEQVVSAVLGDAAGARVFSLAKRMDEMRGEGVLLESAAERLQACITPEGYLRLLPGTFHTDGFFIALVEKLA